jgi:hypothetical protein
MQMTLTKMSGLMILLFVTFSISAIGETSEPAKPDVSMKFSEEKEAKVAQISGLPIAEVFAQLKSDEFVAEPELMYKALHKAFSSRKAEALNFARNYLTSELAEAVDGRKNGRVKDFNIARKVFETFPEESITMMLSLYNEADSVTKGNVIRALGNVSGGEDIRRVLVQALDDPEFAESEDPESLGEPMRVCDIAYNQLVLRYGVRNVLRTISPAHKLDVRDYHIDILIGMLE